MLGRLILFIFHMSVCGTPRVLRFTLQFYSFYSFTVLQFYSFTVLQFYSFTFSPIVLSFFCCLFPPLTLTLLALFSRRLLPSTSCNLFDVLPVSNVELGTHGRNIAPCGTICTVSMGAMVFWVCHKWSNREWWG